MCPKEAPERNKPRRQILKKTKKWKKMREKQVAPKNFSLVTWHSQQKRTPLENNSQSMVRLPTLKF